MLRLPIQRIEERQKARQNSVAHTAPLPAPTLQAPAPTTTSDSQELARRRYEEEVRCDPNSAAPRENLAIVQLLEGTPQNQTAQPKQTVQTQAPMVIYTDLKSAMENETLFRSCHTSYKRLATEAINRIDELPEIPLDQ